MSPALAIGLVVVVAAFLGWWLWATRRRGRRGPAGPRDAWDALDHGIDPTDEPGPGEDDRPPAGPGAEH